MSASTVHSGIKSHDLPFRVLSLDCFHWTYWMSSLLPKTSLPTELPPLTFP